MKQNGLNIKKTMTFNNTYTLKDKNIKKLLDKVEAFITNMNVFTTKHEGYSYKLEISKFKNLWEAEIHIKDEKQNSIKRTEKTL
jgi:hypothetical protein